jgi:hypothetical protein
VADWSAMPDVLCDELHGPWRVRLLRSGARADEVAGVKGLAGDAHSPSATSSMTTHVTGRITSPSTWVIGC